MVDLGGDRSCGVLQQVDAPGVERPLIHPHQLGLELLTDERWFSRQDVAAADIDLVVQRERDRHWREAEREIAIEGDDALDASGAA